MAKSTAGIQQKSFTKGFKGVQGGIGNTGKLLTQLQRVGLQRFFDSPERDLQLSLLKRLSTGEDFGLSPEEAGQIQEQGRLAQEAAFKSAIDRANDLFSRGGLTSGQRIAAFRSANLQRAQGLSDFQRQEFLRRLSEGRQRPLFQLQSIESLSNALTGIPNFSQINDLLRTRILAQQVAQQGQALSAAQAGGSSGGGGSPFGGILGSVAGSVAGRIPLPF